MRLRKSAPTAEPVEQDDPAEDTELVDETTAVRAQAEQARADAHRARAEAETLVATARAEAQRLVAEAEAEARTLSAQAQQAERNAAAFDERAGYLQHADQLRGRIEDAEQQATELRAEADDVAEQIEALTVRLDELGEQREDTTTALTAAREAGEVDSVIKHRNQLAAVDEVVKVLTGQREALQGRLLAIGGPDDPAGELAQVLTQAQAARTELRRIRNALDPERIEAQVDELLDVLQAQVADMTQQPATPRHTIHDLRPVPTNQENPVSTRKNARLLKAEAADQVAVYDVSGNLVGLVDPKHVIPVADMDDVTKQAVAVEVFQQIQKRARR
ncbi:hypothetical protein [Streptomyces sp. RPT161]|uniref:hypothetical protein n=1 Tax=Streptomyces sp. RPT161 TaxID=3015993 RepID=UPI0022B8B8E7|nr:hypothetical protein [Streptomyces sp. RPT161]